MDDNQTDIVERLRSCGIFVEIIGKPVDLLAYHRGVLHLIECKNPDGRDRTTKEQAEFYVRYPGHVHIVRSPDEAVYAILGPQHCDKPREVA